MSDERLLTGGPRVAELNQEAAMLLSSGHVDQAAKVCERVILLDPNDVGGYNILGQCFLARRDAARAEASFRKAIELFSGLPNLHYNLGLSLQAQGRAVEAVEAYGMAVQLDPDSAVPNLKLGQLLLHLGKSKDALRYLQRAVELDPPSKVANLTLGQALLELGELPAAETYIRKALSVAPKDFSAHTALGRILQQRGSFEAAAESFRAAIDLDPAQPSAYFGLAYSKRISEDDRQLLIRMENVRRTLPASKGRSLLDYSLGKAYDDLGEYEAANRRFEQANLFEAGERTRTGLTFSRERFLASIDRIIGTFDRGFFQGRTHRGDSSDLPVLIVGMIRSGTTLVEQILSCHPDVGAAGELPFWRDRGLALVLDSASGSLTNETMAGVVSDYLATLRRADPRASRVTDKMPLNFMALGPVHLLFPNARIIHCRRNAADTCLSVFFTPYRSGPEFAYNRADIAFAYEQYERLMDHWRGVLPEGVFLEVDYEQVVADRERVSKEMIEFLGLPWNDACLSPEANVNRVSTPSQWQVRQPVYRSSTNRWKNYQPWLGEFSRLT
jgi:Flp pilus assembly protein TadD